MTITQPEAPFEAPSDPDGFLDFALEHGWGDGLPLFPPTPERVNAFLLANPRFDPDEVIGVVPPRRGLATVRDIAVNAVMAGCRPEYLPACVTATRCMVDDTFELHAVQSTTHTVAPLVVLHGPVVQEVGAYGGAGCFGPGNRANATIGRTMRLILWNIGGGHPGIGDNSTLGSPSKYTYCVAENAAESPWPSLAERRGIGAGRSAVSVLPVAAPQNVNDHVSGDPVGVLTSVANSMAVIGTNNSYTTSSEMAIAFSPTHARIIADAGWGPDDVSHYLYEHARLPLGMLQRGGMYGMGTWPLWLRCEEEVDRLFPITEDPSDFVIFVAGGEGHHSAILSAMGPPRSVTLPLDNP